MAESKAARYFPPHWAFTATSDSDESDSSASDGSDDGRDFDNPAWYSATVKEQEATKSTITAWPTTLSGQTATPTGATEATEGGKQSLSTEQESQNAQPEPRVKVFPISWQTPTPTPTKSRRNSAYIASTKTPPSFRDRCVSLDATAFRTRLMSQRASPLYRSSPNVLRQMIPKDSRGAVPLYEDKAQREVKEIFNMLSFSRRKMTAQPDSPPVPIWTVGEKRELNVDHIAQDEAKKPSLASTCDTPRTRSNQSSAYSETCRNVPYRQRTRMSNG